VLQPAERRSDVFEVGTQSRLGVGPEGQIPSVCVDGGAGIPVDHISEISMETEPSMVR
jgi:hypothetical protein